MHFKIICQNWIWLINVYFQNVLCFISFTSRVRWKTGKQKAKISFTFICFEKIADKSFFDNLHTSSLDSHYSIVCDRQQYKFYYRKYLWPPQKWQLADEWYFNFQIQPLSFTLLAYWMSMRATWKGKCIKRVSC